MLSVKACGIFFYLGKDNPTQQSSVKFPNYKHGKQYIRFRMILCRALTSERGPCHGAVPVLLRELIPREEAPGVTRVSTREHALPLSQTAWDL